MPFRNNIQVMGNLGKHPELRYMSDGTLMVSLSIAYTEKWNDKRTGEAREATQWFVVLLYQQLAELVEKHMRKGDCIQVEGKLKSREYTDKNGRVRTTYEIIGHNMQMIRTSKREPNLVAE